MSARKNPPFRADHVGSFLRPAALLEARERARTGEITRGRLREIEDESSPPLPDFLPDYRLRGVHAVGRRFGYEEAHAYQVARLAERARASAHGAVPACRAHVGRVDGGVGAVGQADLDADAAKLDRKAAPGGAPADADRAVEGLDAPERAELKQRYLQA